MSASNYPPGVTGREPQITGEWRCASCNAVLPEERTCPRCDGTGKEAYRYEGDPSGGAKCTECEGDGVVPFDGDECPGGCDEPDPDAEHDRRGEDQEDRYGY